jgi:electron transfer flavoprotein-quinone oxidoreductase
MSDDIFDAIVVGAGCAGSVAAYTLASAGKSVLLIDRGNYAGAKNMTGGRIYTHSLAKVFPDFAQKAPLQRRITHEKISLMSPDGQFTMDYTSNSLRKEGSESYSVLRAPFDQWLAAEAENAGAECIFGIPVEDLIMRNGRVCGIIAGGEELEARVTLLCDGANSLLSQKAGLAERPSSHQMAVGVKETLSLSAKAIDERFLCEPDEGCAWMFAGDCTAGGVGGGFLYTNKDTISLGLVATLSSLVEGETPIYELMERFKQRPEIAPIVEGTTLVEYSGHLVPEGGYRMVPALFGDGVLLAGDAAMLCMNLGYQVRGMDLAIASGQTAAQTAVTALDADDVSSSALAGYRRALEDSFVLADLKRFQEFPAYMESNTHIFNEYPVMIDQIMANLFIVDGTPQQRIKHKVMAPLKSLGLFTLLKDAKRGVGAL